MHAPRHSIHDIVSSVCLALGLAMVGAVLAGCAARPIDYTKVPRGALTRDMNGCTANLPLVARAEFADDLEATLVAAAPWSDAAGLVVVVPAIGDEDADLTVIITACPDDQLRSDGSCKHLAETSGRCVGGKWRSEISLFKVDDATPYTLMHELGHALGVNLGCDKYGHSCAPASIMFHQLSDRNALMSFPETGADAPIGPYQWVRPADEAALRRVWGLR